MAAVCRKLVVEIASIIYYMDHVYLGLRRFVYPGPVKTPGPVAKRKLHRTVKTPCERLQIIVVISGQIAG